MPIRFKSPASRVTSYRLSFRMTICSRDVVVFVPNPALFQSHKDLARGKKLGFVIKIQEAYTTTCGSEEPSEPWVDDIDVPFVPMTCFTEDRFVVVGYREAHLHAESCIMALSNGVWNRVAY